MCLTYSFIYYILIVSKYISYLWILCTCDLLKQEYYSSCAFPSTINLWIIVFDDSKKVFDNLPIGIFFCIFVSPRHDHTKGRYNPFPHFVFIVRIWSPLTTSTEVEMSTKYVLQCFHCNFFTPGKLPWHVFAEQTYGFQILRKLKSDDNSSKWKTTWPLFYFIPPGCSKQKSRSNCISYCLLNIGPFKTRWYSLGKNIWQ